MSNPLGGFTVVDAPPPDIQVVDAPPPDHSLLGSIEGAASGLASMVRHPIRTIESVGSTVAKDAYDALFAPIVAGMTHVAPKGAGLYPASSSGAPLTTSRWSDAALNTAINAALPFIPAGVMAKAGARAAIGAIIGAHYDPTDRVRGAVMGATVNEVLHHAAKLLPATEVVDAPPPDVAPETAPPPETPPPIAPANYLKAMPDEQLRQVADNHSAQLGEGGGTGVDERMHTVLQRELQRRGLPPSPDPWAPPAGGSVVDAPPPDVAPPAEAAPVAPPPPVDLGKLKRNWTLMTPEERFTAHPGLSPQDYTRPWDELSTGGLNSIVQRAQGITGHSVETPVTPPAEAAPVAPPAPMPITPADVSNFDAKALPVAVRDQTGRVWTGKDFGLSATNADGITHRELFTRAKEAGATFTPQEITDRGWVTGNGQFANVSDFTDAAVQHDLAPEQATPAAPPAEAGYNPTPPEKLPVAGAALGGLRVTDNIPNQSSIEASVDHPVTLPGVREVPMTDIFGEHKQSPHNLGFASTSGTRQVRDLAEQIKANGYIDPLIVTHDAEGYSVLEGSHRIEALRSLGHESFPALVVEDAQAPPPPPAAPPETSVPPPPVPASYVGTPYEQAMNRGELGVPKPEALTPTVAELGGAPMAEAVARDPTSNGWRVTISDAQAGQLAQQINVPDLVAGSRTTITTPEVHALAQSIGAAKAKLLSLSEAGLAETDPAKAAAIARESDATMAQLGDLGRKTGQGLSETGRTLRAAQIMGDNGADPAFWLYQIKKTAPPGMPLDPAIVARVHDIIRAGLKERPVPEPTARPLPIPPEIADAKAAVDEVRELVNTKDTKGVVTADFTDARFRAKVLAAREALDKANEIYHFSDKAQAARTKAVLDAAMELHTDPKGGMPQGPVAAGMPANPVETFSKYFEAENRKLDAVINKINHPPPEPVAGAKPSFDPVTEYIREQSKIEKSRIANDKAQAKYEARAGAVLDKAAQQKLLQIVRDQTPSSLAARLGRLGRANLIDNPALLGVMGVSHGLVAATEQLAIHPLAAAFEEATARAAGRPMEAAAGSGAGGAYLRTFAESFKKAAGINAVRDAASAVSSGIVDKIKAGGRALWQHYITELPPDTPVAGLEQRRVNFNTRRGNLMNSTDRGFGGASQRFNATIENILNGYTSAILNMHRVVYSPFSDAAFAASLQERAFARALNEGLKRGTPELTARVANLVRTATNPTDLIEAAADGMRAAAETDAERSVFQEPNKAAKLVSQAARPFGKESVLGEIATQSIIPFAKVPANIGWQSLVDLNPIIGVAKAGKLFAKGEHLRAYQSLVRAGLVGSAAAYIGHILATENRISPPPGEQSDEAQVNKQSNIPLTSAQLTVGGPWVNIARFGPVGFQILLGAEITRAWKASEGQPMIDRAGATASAGLFGTTKSLVDQPFLQGTKQAIDALNNEPGAKPLPRILGNILSRFIPGGSLTAAVARGVDPIAQRKSTGFLTEIQNRIPYLRNQSEPVRTPLGDVLPQQGGVAKQMFAPFTPTMENPDALSKELRRIGLGVQPVDKRTGELPAEFAARRALTDPVVRKVLELVINAPVYQQLRPEDQKLVLAEVIHRTRSAMGREVPSMQTLILMLHKDPAYLSATPAARKELEAKVTAAVHAYLADRLVNGAVDTTGQPQ